MKLTQAQKLTKLQEAVIGCSAYKEIVFLIEEALETDGFKHRDLTGFDGPDYDLADEYFFVCIKRIMKDLALKV